MLDFDDLAIPGVKTVSPVRHVDQRGFFSETYSQRSLGEIGIFDTFVQDNHSLTRNAGVIRGLHFQAPPRPVTKLVRVVRGAILDVVVDLRQGSPMFGRHVAVELSAENWTQLYAPVGVAHGFLTLQPDTEVAYKVTDFWDPEVDCGLAWDDPDLDIDWPVDPEHVILSDKDRAQPTLAELPSYFSWGGD